MPGTAIFDLDRTLTRHGTWSRFVFTISRHRPSFWIRLPVYLGYGLLHVAGLIDRDGLKERMIRLFLAGRSRAELAARADAFAEAEVATGLRKGARRVVDDHKARGDRVVIASAAVDLITNPIADRLGADDAICTRLRWSEDDQLTGHLDGPSCYGSEKFRRIKATFGDKTLSGPITFYSDHFSDLDALLWVDTGAAVNPEPKLQAAARQHGLKIEDWNQ
ncbi:MAG: HAD-IB family hydrolase [Pseudomonadota bacterium]